MFYIIGIGLTPKQITQEAKNAIDSCNNIYIDNYTNIFSQGKIEELEKIISKKITQLQRKELEQSLEYLKDDSCLLVIGNAFSATTHYTLIEEAKNKNIKIKMIPGISVFSYIGISGLFEYKFGKTTSIVYPEKNYFPTSFYNTITDNLDINAHTVCLLDIKTDQNRFMSFVEACEILEKIDTNQKLSEKECVVLAGLGSENQTIKTFTFKDHKKIKAIDTYPQTLIICGKLNDFEKGAIDEFR